MNENVTLIHVLLVLCFAVSGPTLWNSLPYNTMNKNVTLVKRSCNQLGDCCFAVEQFAWKASAIRHHLRTIQTIVENVYVWLVGPRRPVSER